MHAVKMKFGETHAVTAIGDTFKGKQQIEIACYGTYELSALNKGRVTLLDIGESAISCYPCRRHMGLIQEEEGTQN